MPQPRRIAFGITELDPGGAERMLTELVTRLDRDEWEPYVYCLGPPAHYAQVLSERQVPVTCFGGSGARSAPRIFWQWTRALRQFQPEILYTWLFHANFLGRLAGRAAGVPVILSGIRVAERRTPWHGRLDRWTNGLVDRNVCVSRDVADFMEQTVGLDPRKTVVIPNGVDLERFRQANPADLTAFGIPANSPVLITIGRLEPQKGIDLLLAGIPAVQSRHPEAHFLIVGDGPDRPALEQQARQLGIADHIHWAGRRDDVPQLLAASTALVLPSRWEGMPNVVLEAMAAGKPVIATQVEGIADLVIPGTTGWLIPIENPPMLAEAIVQILADSARAIAMGKESQVICGKNFTTQEFVRAHSQLFCQFREKSG
ncbi:MAG: glycosyltransferase [Planctomycetaceae bacterium]